MEMDMQEPGDMCRCYANSHIPATKALKLFGANGLHAARIIISVRCWDGTA